MAEVKNVTVDNYNSVYLVKEKKLCMHIQQQHKHQLDGNLWNWKIKKDLTFKQK